MTDTKAIETDVKDIVDQLPIPQLPKDKNSWKDALKYSWTKIKSWLNLLWTKMKGWLLGWLQK